VDTTYFYWLDDRISAVDPQYREIPSILTTSNRRGLPDSLIASGELVFERRCGGQAGEQS
jgi:hypothetical protein